MAVSIKTKFTVLSATLIAMISFAAWDNRELLHEVIGQSGDLVTAARLTHRHMVADMMHDAIRADVLKADLGAKSGNAEMVDAARADLGKHIADLEENFNANRKEALTDELQKAFDDAGSDLKAYEKMADAAVAAAAGDLRNKTGESDKALPQFDAAFEALEKKLGVISGDIEGWAKAQDDELDDAAAKGIRLQGIMAALTVFIALIVPVLSRLWIFRPLGRLIDVMGQLSSGRTDVEVPYTDRSDEIGRIAAALAVFKSNAEEKRRLEKAQEEQKKQTEAERKRAMDNLADTFESGVMGVVDTVAAAATEMDMSARSVVEQSEGSGKKLGGLLQGVETSAHNVQTVASAAAELSASINEINTQVSRSVRITAEAVQEAKRANETSLSLSEAAQKIGTVLTVINEIAGQINLLALNATIEAARAGEAGKGFAVVASEVKNLANQTTKATQEIEGQISMIQSAAGDTVTVIQTISGTIEEINRISSSIAAAVEEQGTATQEIARNVQQASDITQMVTVDAGEVQKSAASATTAASQMVSAARELASQADKLKGQVERFLNGVRAA
jgi:methyl-accepting chemotaxis protein